MKRSGILPFSLFIALLAVTSSVDHSIAPTNPCCCPNYGNRRT